MRAIIETGGKQYKVTAGDVIYVEKLEAAEGDELSFDRVLALIGEDDSVEFGAPYIKGAAVKAAVVENGKEKKVIVYRYKSKKHYHKKKGHRQPYTKVRIGEISA